MKSHRTDHSAVLASSFTGRLARRWFGKCNAGEARAWQASKLRELARKHRNSDPGFASDLMAAADVHTRDND